MNGVTVVVGITEVSQAIARQICGSRKVLLAGIKFEKVEDCLRTLADGGYDVAASMVDVTDRRSVESLVEEACSLGPVERLVHTVDFSSSFADWLQIAVFGTANVLELFGEVVKPGGSGLVVVREEGFTLLPLDASEESMLAVTPAEELGALPLLARESCLPALETERYAHNYTRCRRAPALRVAAEAVLWGKRGARINCISHGFIATEEFRAQLWWNGSGGMAKRVDLSPAGRAGRPDEIAGLAAFLMSEEGSFVTGSDFLIDGGLTSSIKYVIEEPDQIGE